MTTGNVSSIDIDSSELIILSTENRGKISGRKICWIGATSLTGGVVGAIAGTVIPYFSVSLLSNGYHDPVTLCAAAAFGGAVGVVAGVAIGALAGLGCIKCKNSIESNSKEKPFTEI